MTIEILFLILFITILITLVAFLTLFCFNVLIPFVFNGALYFPTRKNDIETIVVLAQIQKEDRVVDLGSGDGRIILELAKKGFQCHGYEINPFLMWLTRLRIIANGLQDRAFVRRENFWKKHMGHFDVIVVYQHNFAMKQLERKVIEEAKPGTRIISNYFLFPNLTIIKKANNLYLYQV